MNAAVVPVTGVTLSKTTLTLAIGTSETLVATIAPDNATNQAVKWESSNPNVATMVSTGLVIAIAPGSATIVVTSQDGNKTATCAVTVVPDVPSDPYMTMPLQPSSSATIALIASGTATINWGDGVSTTHTLNTTSVSSYRHTYSGTAAITITIVGNDISQLLCNNNRLTSFDVTKNMVLKELICGENQLTAKWLNAMFGTLHSNAGSKKYPFMVTPASTVAAEALHRLR